MKHEFVEGLRLLHMDIHEFIGDCDADIKEKDYQDADTHQMQIKFCRIYDDYQNNNKYTMWTSHKSKIKLVEKWCALYYKFRYEYIDKQQRYATNTFEKSESCKRKLFDLQVAEKMKQKQSSKIAENDRKILKQFDDNLKGAKENNKINCTITAFDLKSMFDV